MTPLDPGETHRLEQFGARVREIAREIAGYRRELIAGGMPEGEAWALTQRLEERWMGPEFDRWDAERAVIEIHLDADQIRRLLTSEDGEM